MFQGISEEDIDKVVLDYQDIKQIVKEVREKHKGDWEKKKKEKGNWRDQVSEKIEEVEKRVSDCLLYTSPSPRDQRGSRMPPSA